MLHSDRCALNISNQNRINNHYAPLNYVDAATLERAAKADAKSLAQVAWVCLSEGISDAYRQRYSWATVKLYHAAFQALRARLLWSGNIIFYRNATPHWIATQPGANFIRRGGNTHSAVFMLFRELFPSNPIFAQPIDGTDALEWIDRFRNRASYNTAPISDPAIPHEFQIFSQQPRLFLSRCLDISSGIGFDKDTAIIAFPFFLILSFSDLLASGGEKKIILIEKFFIDILVNEALFIPDFHGKLNAFAFAP